MVPDVSIPLGRKRWRCAVDARDTVLSNEERQRVARAEGRTEVPRDGRLFDVLAALSERSKRAAHARADQRSRSVTLAVTAAGLAAVITVTILFALR